MCEENKEIFAVSKEGAGVRIDRYLSDCYPQWSRSYLQKLLKDENILVGGSKTKANYKLREGDEITILIPPLEDVEILPEDIPLDILYEDQWLLIVNKPKGMVVHPAPGNYTGTLVNALMYHLDGLSGINGVIRPGIVHRLDKDTSGLLVVAKNDDAHKSLAEQIKEKMNMLGIDEGKISECPVDVLSKVFDFGDM